MYKSQFQFLLGFPRHCQRGRVEQACLFGQSIELTVAAQIMYG